MMIHTYPLVVVFFILRLHTGYQQSQEPTQNEGEATEITTEKIEKTTHHILLKYDGYENVDNPLQEHHDYFLPNGYLHHEEDDLDEPDLYPDYDYDSKGLNYGDVTEVSTPKSGSDLKHNYVSFDDDIPLQSTKDNLPMFLLEPEDAFVIKNKPATLKCRAAKALEVYFKCNGIKSSTINFEFVDPHTGVRIVEGEYNVTREQVEEYFGKDKFKCSCFAWTGRGQIRSRAVYIEIAYIKKQFAASPRAALVEQHAAARLRCEPPAAAPRPRLYWLKDGAPLPAAQDGGSGGGDLVIGRVTLQDMGNYSCVAENIAGKRISDPALLTVYVNGGWSAWGGWGACACAGRTEGRRRARACTEPRPLHGGQPCAGAAVQKTQDCVHCDIDLYMDIEDELPDNSELQTGVWSPWSEWSRCDADCLQARRRRCAAGPCSGKDYQLAHCPACTSARDASSMSSYWPLFVGLVVAFTILMVMLILGIKYIKINVHEHPNYVKTTQDPPSHYYGNTGKKSLPRQPDLTMHSGSDMGLPQSDGKLSSVTDNNFREHLYEVPQLNNGSANIYMAPVDYERRPCNLSMRENVYGDKPYSLSEQSDSSCFISSESSYDRDSEDISPSLKNNLSAESNSLDPDRSDTAVSGPVAASGGWLHLDKCAVSAYFPEGSVDSSCNELFWLRIIKEDWNRPLLPEGMTQLSPVIKCGPQHIRLKMPVILQFPHCAMLKNSNWIVSLLEKKQEQNPIQWTQVFTLGEEVNNKTIFLQVDSDRVYLMTEHLSDFVLVGKSFSGFDIKLLKIAVFASDNNVEQVMDYNLRVYIFEDTLCALYYCLENERKLGGQLVDNPKTMYCQDGCSDLCFSLEEIGLGWKARPGSAYQQIPFSHVWNANLNSLHCSFTLERTDSINSLEFKIVVFQKKCPSNKQIFNVRPHEMHNFNFPPLSRQLSRSSLNRNTFCNIFENPMNDACSGNTNANEYYTRKESSLINYDKTYSSSVDCTSRVRLSKYDKMALCGLLDPTTSKGNDWRMLAEKLGFDKCFEYFAARSSPTANILNLWEAGGRGLVELSAAFRLMERSDCASVVERYVGSNWI